MPTGETVSQPLIQTSKQMTYEERGLAAEPDRKKYDLQKTLDC